MKSPLPVLLLICALSGQALADRSQSIIDFSSPDTLARIVPSVPTVTVKPGPEVIISPGEANYPGVSIDPPAGEKFDGSTFGHIQAEITNTGTQPIRLSLRADNDDVDWRLNPWNGEAITLKPGATGTVKVYFGYSFGGQAGYPLKPGAISKILLFGGKKDFEQSFKINSLTFAGKPGDKPPVDPGTVRVEPPGGKIFGSDVKVDPAKQLAVRGTKATVADGAIRVTLPPGTGSPTATFKPAAGKWNLGKYLQIRARVRNAGTKPMKPLVGLESGGPIGMRTTPKPLAPGEEAEIIVSFIPENVIDLADKATHGTFRSAAAAGIMFSAENSKEEQTLDVLSILAEVPEIKSPAWLGKRPPVEGDWELRLDDNFDGPALDEALWMTKGNNYWDSAKTRFLPSHNIFENGGVKLRFEKKQGHIFDDPTKPVTQYVAGYFRAYDKWRQRYGYFESRMKVPSAPGLWPGFWLMPDRGPSAGDGVARQATENGGMEFDIMEHLTRWGPYRYNVALHWDGYGKAHQAVGCDAVYVEPDKDGYFVSGLLWLPGKVVFYCNGREIAKWENERVAAIPSYIMYTFPSGGWDNDPTDDKTLPADFEIDYVRVWQRKDLASDQDSPKHIAGSVK